MVPRLETRIKAPIIATDSAVSLVRSEIRCQALPSFEFTYSPINQAFFTDLYMYPTPRLVWISGSLVSGSNFLRR